MVRGSSDCVVGSDGSGFACRVGLILGCLWGLVLLTGCPLFNPCANVDCDDGNPCTADTCSNGECGHEPVNNCCELAADCNDDKACTTDICSSIDIDTGAGTCTHVSVGSDCCNEDGDCGDGEVCVDHACTAICTSDEDCAAGQTCDVPTGRCVGVGGCESDNDCEANQICNLDTGLCVPKPESCTVDGDCEDEIPCTTDSCESGTCRHELACDDGLDCTDDSCDLQAGECTHESNCPSGEQCDLTSGQCEPAVECQADSQCEDDGVFCNGDEICGDDGTCVSEGNPCSAGLTCTESTRSCTTPPPACIDFTTAIETKSGSASSDSFCATWNSTANGPTLQTGDVGNGSDGIDSLSASFQFTSPSTVQPTLSAIETISITDLGTAATTLSTALVTGATKYVTSASSNPNPLILSNLAGVTDIGIENTGSGLTVQFAAAATVGNADVLDVILTDASGGALTITSGTVNGIETVAIISNGSSNTLTSVDQNVGSTLATLTVTGNAPLTITNALPTSLSTVTATGATGGVTLDLSGNASSVSVTGGAGNDTFTFGANYGASDVVAGGGGTNSLLITSAAASVGATQSNVTGISVLTITDGLANAVTASRFGTISTVNLRQGFTGAVALTVASGTTINLGSDGASTDSSAAGSVTVDGAGTTDTVTVNLRDHDTLALTLSGVETLNLQSNHRADGTVADGGVNLINGTLTVGATGMVNLTGAANLTIAQVVTAGTISGTAFTGALVMRATSASAINITTGQGNDTLFGSASADTLNAGSGTNVIEGRSGIDNIGPLGAGVDTIRINIAGVSGADRKLVTGFTAGVGGDVVNIDADDLAALSGSDDFVSSAALQTHSAAGALVAAAATEVVRVTSATVANFTDVNSLNGTNLLAATGDPNQSITVQGSGDGILVLVADVSGNTGVYFGDTGGDSEIVAAELTLVAVLQATPIANLVYSNFSNAN